MVVQTSPPAPDNIVHGGADIITCTRQHYTRWCRHRPVQQITLYKVAQKTKPLATLGQISGQSNMTKMLHCRQAWSVQQHSPCCANVHPHLIHESLDPPESTNQIASPSVQPFLHSSRQTVPILCHGPPFHSQNCPFAMRIWTPSNTWFIGSTQVHNRKGISISSVAFTGLTS